jgi:hypothetical protein
VILIEEEFIGTIVNVLLARIKEVNVILLLKLLRRCKMLTEEEFVPLKKTRKEQIVIEERNVLLKLARS